MSAAEPSTKIDFMKMRYFWFIISVLQVVWSIYVWTNSGLDKYSIDFLGGTDLTVKFSQSVDPAEIRSALAKSGMDGDVVQGFEQGSNEFSIRYKGSNSGNLTAKIQAALNGIGGSISVLKNDFVGPVIGEKIKQDGLKAIAISILGLLIYIGWRFEFVYGIGAIIAVFHDVIISAGLFIYFGGEIGTGALAALLTILGYSVNDTI